MSALAVVVAEEEGGRQNIECRCSHHLSRGSLSSLLRFDGSDHATPYKDLKVLDDLHG